jgi:aminocarboxymuconate-semialdehyde decarboxylase
MTIARAVEFVSCLSRGVMPRGGGVSTARAGSRLFTIDIHCHVLSKRAEAHVRANFKGERPNHLASLAPLTREVNQRQNRSIEPQLTEVDERLSHMAATGVDMQALSPAPTHYYYWMEAGLGREACRITNDDIAEMAATDIRRFVSLGTVPLQDTQLAVEEMRRCVRELGMRGIEINSEVGGEELSSPRLEPFFAAAEEMGVLIFLHPAGFSDRRLRDHYLSNVIGNPLNSTIALSHLIFDGTLERHPGLKICVAHGGGFLPTYQARMDHAYAAREDCRLHISRPPSDYLKQLYFDTVVFDPEQIAFLVHRFGVDRMVLGTDFPYDMAEDDPVGLVMKVPGLTDEQRAAICGANAARLLGIPLPAA